MTIHDLALLAFILPTTFIVLRADHRLKFLPPMKRVGLGVASFGLMCVVLVVTTVIRPTLQDQFHTWNFIVLTSSALFGGFLMPSVMQILGGAAQAFKRWHYYRRASAKHP